MAQIMKGIAFEHFFSMIWVHQRHRIVSEETADAFTMEEAKYTTQARAVYETICKKQTFLG